MARKPRQGLRKDETETGRSKKGVYYRSPTGRRKPHLCQDNYLESEGRRSLAEEFHRRMQGGS